MADTFHHVRDFPFFELPHGVGSQFEYHGHTVYGIQLPNILGLQITKFMVLQLVAAGLTFVIFRGLSKRVQSGEPTRGRFWNFWEVLALYIRDEVVRPTIGDHHHDDHGDDDHGGNGHGDSDYTAKAGHDADRFLPFIWSCFFYILFCNLLGAVPMLGSPTGAISVTIPLAIAVFVHNIIAGTRQFGFIGFLANQCPPMDVPPLMKMALVPLIWVLEILGLVIKHVVLAIRLFANIMAGHTVVGVMLGFIAADGVAGTGMAYLVTPASIFGQVAIGLLELFVAFLQAYVFAFLATMFLSTCVHSH
jgi:F-type H+-transporting ATPase subunit a